MSNHLEPSTSQGVKRRIELISSEPLESATCSTNGDAGSHRQPLEKFLNFKLFSDEEIASIAEADEVENIRSLHSSLQSLFKLFHEKCRDNGFKLWIFEQLSLWLTSIKENNRGMLTKLKDVRNRIRMANHNLKNLAGGEENMKELLKELMRELMRFRAATDPFKLKLTKKEAERARKLKAAIDKLENMISNLQEAEYGMDDLDNDTCPYLQIPKLKRFLLTYWNEYETIIGRCPKLTGDENYFYKFEYKNDKLPTNVREAVERFFHDYINKIKKFDFAKGRVRGKASDKKEVPLLDIADLKKCLQTEIDKSAATFQLSNELVDEIFTDLIKEQKRRRLFKFVDGQYYYNFESTSVTMADESSEELSKELQANKEKREQELDKLMEEFVDKQHEQNGREEVVEGFDDDNLIQLNEDDEAEEETGDDDDDDDEREEDDAKDPLDQLDVMFAEFENTNSSDHRTSVSTENDNSVDVDTADEVVDAAAAAPTNSA